MNTLTVRREEIDLLVDALQKGSARHAAYARFYPGRQRDRHIHTAAAMTQLRLRLQKLRERMS